jgi:hypothetical protein
VPRHARRTSPAVIARLVALVQSSKVENGGRLEKRTALPRRGGTSALLNSQLWESSLVEPGSLEREVEVDIAGEAHRLARPGNSFKEPLAGSLFGHLL